MKILHVITSLKTGGAEKLMVDLLPKLNDLGNDVELLIFDGTITSFYSELKLKGIKIHHLAVKGNVYNPLNIFRLLKYISKYDIIHTHNTICQLYVPIAKLLSFSKTIIITTEHNSTNRRRSKKIFWRIDKWMYSKYSRIICIAEKTKYNLEKHIGTHNKIILIYNGVNLNKYLAKTPTYSINDNIIITMVAGFREQKDQDTLIRAMSYLPDNYILQLVGDGERRGILENLVSDLGLDSRVALMGIRNDVPEILQNSDIVVLSSHWEGLSLSSIEGMASGKPFIASNVDGLYEIVEGHGVLFPEGDSQQLAKEIEHLGSDKDYAAKVAKACQMKAMQYDISIMAEKYNNLYKNL